MGLMRILVVEDNKRIAQNIKEGLLQEAFVVDVASDGEMGFDLAYAEEYEVIVLDLMLPKMDGETICRKLRSSGKQTPILMLTAKDGLNDKVNGLNLGADDYLAKPFAFAELVARIKALARRPRNMTDSVIRVRDLTVDLNQQRVYRLGTQIDLSLKEYLLLSYMARNSPKVVSKQQLIDNVWEFEACVMLNTVEVHIRHLRRKIDEPFADLKPLITTVRGFGYMLK